MINNLKPSVLIFFLLVFISSCQKEISFETEISVVNNDEGSHSGTALFRLEGTPNECAEYVVGGTYSLATALTTTNVVAINVMVDSVGTYSISTANINGIQFSAAGNFLSTGLQTVMLNASGMPLATGIFNYKPGRNCCSFPVTVNSPIPPIADAVLDCSHAWSAGNFVAGVTLTDSSKLFVPVNVTTAGSYSVNSAPLDGVTFSASGTLETGAQIITLLGNGKPKNPGAFPLEISFGGNTCSFYVTFQ